VWRRHTKTRHGLWQVPAWLCGKIAECL
jgi:hypothetical protein